MNPGDLVTYKYEYLSGGHSEFLCMFVCYTAKQEALRTKNFTPCMILLPKFGIKHVLADKLRKIE
jgi:hypothetical protein